MSKQIEHCKAKLRQMYSPELINDEMLDNIVKEASSIVQDGKYDKRLKKFIQYTEQQQEFIQKQNLYNKKVLADHLKTFKENPRAAYEAILAPSRSAGANKNSLSINIESISDRSKNFFTASLRKEGLNVDQALNRLHDPKYSLDILEALDGLNKNLNIDHLSPDVKGLANSIKRSFDYGLKKLKELGLEINQRDDYLVRQTHDAGKMGKAGKDEWVSYIRNKLDDEKTFGDIVDVKEQDKILNDIYQDIMSSDYSGAAGSTLGKKRILHFKDYKAFGEYHDAFGTGSLYDVVLGSIRSMSKTEATYTILGSRPKEMLKDLKDRASKMILDTEGHDASMAFKTSTGLQSLEKEVLGYGQRPVAQGLSKAVGQAVDFMKGVQITAKLGGAAFSTVTDLAVASSNLMAKTGLPAFTAYNKLISSWSKNLSPAERRKLGVLIGVAADSDLNRITGESSASNLFGKFTNGIMKATLLDATTKINRTSMGLTLSNHLAELSGKNFDSLHPRLAAEFKSFGIGSKEWSQISKAIDSESVKGLPVITFEKMDELGIPTNVQNKYGAFLTHNSNFGAIAPDAKARSFLRLGQHPDSTMGKMLSALFLFKSFSVRASGAIEEILKSNPNANNAALLNALGDKGNLALLSNLMVAGTGLSMVGLAARDLAFNKTPRDFTKPENVMEAFTRSVLPLWGEYTVHTLAGDYDSFGRNLAKDLAGPVVGMADDTISFLSSLSKDLTEDKRSGRNSRTRGIRLLQQNLPGSYIPVLRPILDKLLWDGILEANNPRYKQRLAKKMNEKGQNFLIE